jgi:hypothetical protein
MLESTNVTIRINTPKAINLFLIENQSLIKDNPAISPDLVLDFAGFCRELSKEPAFLATFPNPTVQPNLVVFYPQSELPLCGGKAFIVESRRTGDTALILRTDGPLPFMDVRQIEKLSVIPMTWENLIILKNTLIAEDPEVTVFPTAQGTLAHSSLGVGARFTTLHWPAVAWVMKTLKLSLTANQNSIPRELVYDVDAMLEQELAEVPFPFIGTSVPEGHQGQSVQGMSHAAVVTYLKLGFHRHRIPWGFNADHQPIGGRFDAIEDKLVEGSLFASYITYDLSPELTLSKPILDNQALATQFAATVDPKVHAFVINRLLQLGISVAEIEIKRLETYLWSAMQKMLRRDQAYSQIRQKTFTSELGQAFFKELSIDELPGQTTPETMAVCLAMAEALGVTFNFVAPNIGFQKNFPYPDNTELRTKVSQLFEVARKFNVSFGFHSGSGKSAENYSICGQVTGGRLEIKTSGRYTYEMGAALAASPNLSDKKLWTDWYQFTRTLVAQGAFSNDQTQRTYAREFITKSLQTAGKPVGDVFQSPAVLEKALAALTPSPDHMFWFEYNFLFVLAAGGATSKLGDHTHEGYAQRARFYAISEEGKLLFAKNVANYILFLAQTTGLCPADRIAKAKQKLDSFTSFGALIADIA